MRSSRDSLHLPTVLQSTVDQFDEVAVAVISLIGPSGKCHDIPAFAHRQLNQLEGSGVSGSILKAIDQLTVVK